MKIKNTILNKTVLASVSIHLKLPVATATHGDLVLPLLEIKLIKVILENEDLGSESDSSRSQKEE